MRRKITMLFVALLACAGVMKAGPTDLPQITTDPENPIYYTIYNTRSDSPGGLIYYAGDDAGIKDGCASLKLEDKYQFFFTGTHEAMYIHNKATKKKMASVNSWTDAGAEWAVGVSPKGTGVAFGPKGGLNGNECWNEQNQGRDGFTTWSANDDGSIFVVELASSYVAPISDMFYVIECPLFEKVQGVKKAIYVNNEGKAVWGTEDLTNNNFYWIPTIKEDGTIALKNFGTNTYLSNVTGDMSDTQVYGNLNVLGSNSFNIKFNGGTIHANNHNNGNGNSSNLVDWGGTVGSASAWTFVQKNDPTALKEVVVKYSFTYGNEEKYTQETTTLVGEEYPAINIVLPFGVSVGAKPAGTVEAAGTHEIALTIEQELPFVAAADVNSIDTWYYARMHTNQPGYIGDIADDKTINVAWGKASDVYSENFVWGFVGNVFDGIVMVNKAGLQITSTGGGNATLTAVGTPFFVARTTETSANATNGFCLRKKDSNNYLNANYGAGKLSHWGSTDAGSTIFLTKYEETEISISSVDWATMYLGYSVYIPEGVSAYTVASTEGGYATLNQLEGVIPANTGVLLENEGEYTFQKAAKDPGAIADNLLKGSVEKSYVEGLAYVLANGEKGVGLYRAKLNKDAEGNEGDTHFLNNAGKAYLVLPAVAEGEEAPAMFTLGRGGEGTTAIHNSQFTIDNVVIYDLAGRRVEKMEKGIYIVNGKKVIR